MHPVTHDKSLELVPDFSSSFGWSELTNESCRPAHRSISPRILSATATASGSASVIPTQGPQRAQPWPPPPPPPAALTHRQPTALASSQTAPPHGFLQRQGMALRSPGPKEKPQGRQKCCGSDGNAMCRNFCDAGKAVFTEAFTRHSK